MITIIALFPVTNIGIAAHVAGTRSRKVSMLAHIYEIKKADFERDYGHVVCQTCLEPFWCRKSHLESGNPVFCPNGHAGDVKRSLG